MTGTAKKIAASLALGLGLLALAPANAQDATVTFKSRSELVLVPVIVTDHKGGHVAGLKKEDFVLHENGVERKIAIFDEVVADTAPVVVPKRGESAFSNERGATSAKRLVVLALDAINTPINDQIRARKQMLKFLAEGLDRDALISVVVLTPAGVKIVHDFTADTSLLVNAVSKLTRKASFSEQNADAVAVDDSAQQGETAQLSALTESVNQSAAAGQKQLVIRWTYDAFTQIAQAYAGVPGRKSLIWVTAGFPFSFADNNNQISAIGGNGDVSDNLDAYERMWQALTQANFAVYPVDARGLVNTAVISASTGGRAASGKGALPNMAAAQMTAQSASIETFRDLADMTGGKAFFNTNDLVKSFREASNDSASYYMLGFYMPKDAQPGWHRVKVKLDRGGTQLRARSGYLVGAKNSAATDTENLRNAIISPFDSTALPVEVRWTSQSRAAGETKTTAGFTVVLTPANVTVDESDNNHMSFDVIAVAKQSDGTVAASLEKPVEGHVKPANLAVFQKSGMVYDGKLQLAAGQYVVRFLVEDRLTGRIGSVSAPLTIR